MGRCGPLWKPRRASTGRRDVGPARHRGLGDGVRRAGIRPRGGGSRLPRSLDCVSNGPPPPGERNPERNEPQERASLGRAWDVVNGGPLCVCLPLTRSRGGEARGPGNKMTGNALCGLSPAPPLPRSARLIASSVPSLQEKKPGSRRGAAMMQIVCHACRGATKPPARPPRPPVSMSSILLPDGQLALQRALPQGDLAERPLSARHGGRRRGRGLRLDPGSRGVGRLEVRVS